MKRGEQDTISQWDRDNFNVECKRFFNGFTEFVAMHYALSHRNDTEYWRDISNKSFYENRITDDSIKLDLLAKMNNKQWLNSDAGVHCIGTGLRYFGFDMLTDTSSDEEKAMIKLRDLEVKKWNTVCKE